MAVHTCMKKSTAKDLAKRYRKKGLNVTIAKKKKGYGVYTDQKGRR